MRLVDTRASRFEQTIVVVILLAGFVFRQAWSIPTAGIVAALGVLPGARSPVQRLWYQVIAPRRPAPASFDPTPIAQTQSMLIFAGLAGATLVWLLGSVALASIIAAVVAVIAALGATGVMNTAAELRRRGQRD